MSRCKAICFRIPYSFSLHLYSSHFPKEIPTHTPFEHHPQFSRATMDETIRAGPAPSTDPNAHSFRKFMMDPKASVMTYIADNIPSDRLSHIPGAQHGPGGLGQYSNGGRQFSGAQAQQMANTNAQKPYGDIGVLAQQGVGGPEQGQQSGQMMGVQGQSQQLGQMQNGVPGMIQQLPMQNGLQGPGQVPQLQSGLQGLPGQQPLGILPQRIPSPAPGAQAVYGAQPIPNGMYAGDATGIIGQGQLLGQSLPPAPGNASNQNPIQSQQAPQNSINNPALALGGVFSPPSVPSVTSETGLQQNTASRLQGVFPQPSPSQQPGAISLDILEQGPPPPGQRRTKNAQSPPRMYHRMIHDFEAAKSIFYNAKRGELQSSIEPQSSPADFADFFSQKNASRKPQQQPTTSNPCPGEYGRCEEITRRNLKVSPRPVMRPRSIIGSRVMGGHCAGSARGGPGTLYR